MDGRSERGTQGRRVARVMIAASVALGAFGPAAGPAGASGIRRHHLIVVSSAQSLGPSWARFLSGRETLWESARPPAFPSGLVLPTRLGRLVDTPFVDYLNWRRSLDPARFDHYHPNVGPELALPAPHLMPTPAATATGGGTKHPFRPAPQNLPEPGSLGIAVVLLGAGLAVRNRARGRRADADR